MRYYWYANIHFNTEIRYSQPFHFDHEARSSQAKQVEGVCPQGVGHVELVSCRSERLGGHGAIRKRIEKRGVEWIFIRLSCFQVLGCTCDTSSIWIYLVIWSMPWCFQGCVGAVNSSMHWLQNGIIGMMCEPDYNLLLPRWWLTPAQISVKTKPWCISKADMFLCMLLCINRVYKIGFKVLLITP